MEHGEPNLGLGEAIPVGEPLVALPAGADAELEAPPEIVSSVDAIFAVSAGLRNPLQMTMWPSRTRSVSAARALSEVNDSNVSSSVGFGTVWKWSKSQIDSDPRRSACCATATVRAQAGSAPSRRTRPSTPAGR